MMDVSDVKIQSLQLQNITKYYQDGQQQIEVLQDINFNVLPGEFAAIIGPSGAGKSTFLSIAGALLQPSSGDVIIGGQNLKDIPLKKWAQLRLDKIGFIFQNAELIPYLNVLDQLNYIRVLAHKMNDDSTAKSLLNNLGLSHRLKQYPSMLSGGEKQRVAIARAFINDPDLILADEPTASLDSKRGHEVVSMIRDQVHQQTKAAVMVTHDERILNLVDSVYQIEDGQIIKV